MTLGELGPRTEQCPWAAAHEAHLWHGDELWCDGVASTGDDWDADDENAWTT